MILYHFADTMTTMGTYMKNLDSESLNFVILWNLQIKLNPLESIIAVVITQLIVNSTHSN